ncbi:hypothetical protein FB451DRAFT_731360 [Mycena latifolia]|nr:hypothetical protein FB451DRAFT_731360 [Mycena latifolia]
MEQRQLCPPQCLFNICLFILQAAGETSEKLTNCDCRALIAPWLGCCSLRALPSSHGSAKCGKCDSYFLNWETEGGAHRGGSYRHAQQWL